MSLDVDTRPAADDAVQQLHSVERRLYAAVKAIKASPLRQDPDAQNWWASAFQLEIVSRNASILPTRSHTVAQTPAFMAIGLSAVVGKTISSGLVQVVWSQIQRERSKFHLIDLTGVDDHSDAFDWLQLPDWWTSDKPRDAVIDFSRYLLPVRLNSRP